MMNFKQVAEKTIKENNILLDKFEKYLVKQGLSKKSITNHVDNVDFYVNDFLIGLGMHEEKYEDGNIIIPNAIEGIIFEYIDEFLGNFFIRKCMWSSEYSIKSNIASFKKFYTFLEKEKYVSSIDLQCLKENIKEYKDEWIRKLNLYDDPDVDIEDLMDEF